MKAYILTEDDFAALLTAIDRDPRRGTQGGSSDVLTQKEQDAFDKAQRFFNYQIRSWLDRVKK